MNHSAETYRHILVASDFSEHSTSAIKQAIWLAGKHHARITVAHVFPNIRKLMLSSTLQARMDFLYGEGEKFHEEVREKSNARMQEEVTALNPGNLEVSYLTLIGEPFQELTHAVLSNKCDLVIAGSRGLKAWKSFLVGSTASRLIRNCPASVWVVKDSLPCPPLRILAPTDFSEVSLKAVRHGFQLAKQSRAEFHVLHVVDSMDIPEVVVSKIPEGASFQQEMNEDAERELKKLQSTLGDEDSQVHVHTAWGTPWKEIKELIEQLQIDTVAMGTVGRSGIKGVLLGNTAEKVLSVCGCSILTTKPDDFVSTIQPAFWELNKGD